LTYTIIQTLMYSQLIIVAKKLHRYTWDRRRKGTQLIIEKVFVRAKSIT